MGQTTKFREVQCFTWFSLSEEDSNMSYQLYRNTTLGHTLQESLDELMQLQMLSPALALRVLIQFDKSINNALATRVKTKLHFKVTLSRLLLTIGVVKFLLLALM